MYVFTTTQEDGESHDKRIGNSNGQPFGLDGEALKASKSDEKDTEVLAQKVWILEQENAALRENHIQDTLARRVSDRNVALILEKKVQSLGAEVQRLDTENRLLKKKLND